MRARTRTRHGVLEMNGRWANGKPAVREHALVTHVVVLAMGRAVAAPTMVVGRVVPGPTQGVSASPRPSVAVGLRGANSGFASDFEKAGRMRWLKCLSCHRRCRVIYGGRYFRCRQCHGLHYQSQREPAYDRAIEQATRIRKRLGDDMFSAFESDELPPKPPRMRWKTYHRLETRYAGLQNRWRPAL